MSTKVVCLGITTVNPLSIERFKGPGGKWAKYIKRHGQSKKNLKITMLHESHDLNVIKQWRKYYYDCWDVLNNSKFIHSKRKRTCPKNSGPNNYMYGRSIVKELNLRWYTDGISKNLRIPENTQPIGFKPGRVLNYYHAITEDGKARIGKAHSKACIDPNGRKFKSLREAAKEYGVSDETIRYKIKKGYGWRYA